MKGSEKKHIFWSKMKYLRYSTDELGMISVLFSRIPFIKILFYHLTILISRFRITMYFLGNFPEISPKFSEKFRENSRYPTYTPYPPPMLCTHTQYPKPWTHSELQIQFSRNSIFGQKVRFFSDPFKYLANRPSGETSPNMYDLLSYLNIILPT